MGTEKKTYHFVGIGGIGMSALAHILLERDHNVSGSDLSLTDTVSLLKAKGATIMDNHSSENITNQQAVIYGSAIQENNPEMIAAKERGCALIHRSELLAQLISTSTSLAVTGMHGKTTVSSLLSSVLLHAERDISFAVGGYVKEYGTNGRSGKDELFVLEADESDGTFLHYHPTGAIITNIEEEHMDYFVTKERLHASFAQFFTQVQDEKLLFYCGDDEILCKMASGKGSSYGFSAECEYRILNFRQKGWHVFFDLLVGETLYSEIEVALIGKHNALNAVAVFALALRLGLPEGIIREGLRLFEGVGRRCDKTFENEKILFIDDYAHHPTEIQITLESIKEAIGDRRLVVFFQPHRYTRTQNHLDEFAQAFDAADLLFISDIYAASEQPIEGISTELLLEKIRIVSTVKAHYMPLEETVQRIENVLCVHDVVVTMGAGSITYLNRKLIEHVSKESVRRLKVGLVFGGQSVEHAISRCSARFVADQLSRQFYDITYFSIDKEGRWQIGERAKQALESEEGFSFEGENLFFTDIMRTAIEELDLFFPVLHGTNGEDGIIQGLFELFQKAYVGPNYRTAAVGMDKVMTKRLLQTASVPTPPFIAFDGKSWKRAQESYLKQIKENIPFPLYVKPSHLGSSVGVSKVYTEEALLQAITHAFLFDTHVLVECSIEKGRELEFAVIGDESLCEVPPPGEKLAQGAFVSYEMKYGVHPVKTAIVAELDEATVKRGQALALQAYRALGGSGMTRVDFILDQEGTFWCFEVNPIPGMQKLSLFPKMWEKAGLSNSRLFDRLILLALGRQRECQRVVRQLSYL